jgi:putative ABC transport system permease protein
MLWRMLWADTRALARETVVLAVLIGLGVLLYVGLYEAHQNLTGTYDHIYRTNRFASASVLMAAGPESLVDKARSIPSVTAAIGRVVKDGTIVQKGKKRERVAGRFIGCPRRQRPAVNDILIVEGRYIANPREAVLEQQFARENGYRVGDRIKCDYQGVEREFALVGLATSPEYIYPVPSKHTVFVARGAFGVVFVDEEEARGWLGAVRRITELHCLTQPGHEEKVRRKLEGICHSYGIETSYVADEQPSKHLLDMDQQGLAQMSVFFPVLFLSAAGLSLYGALARIVRLQVTVIGTLKACGFGNREILRHYTLQGLLVSLAGAVPGVVGGHWLAVWIGRMYADALKLPLILSSPRLDTISTGLVLAAGTGLLAALLPARMAARARPALAMRGDIGEERGLRAQRRILRWTRCARVLYCIPVRGVFRRASRTLLAVGGIAGGAVIMITTFGMYVSTMDAIDEYLTGTRRYELDVQFTSPAGVQVAEAVAAQPGGRGMGLTVSVPVRLRTSWGTAELILTGLERGQRLLTPRTRGGRVFQVEPDSIWVPKQVAKRLMIEPGDPVLVEWVKSGRRQRFRRQMRVGGLVDAAIGGAAYGEYSDVRRAFADAVFPGSSYGAHIACAPSLASQRQHQLERSDDVAMVSTTQDAVREINEQMALMFVFIGVLLSFGTVLAWSAIHSVATVSMLERTRELGTLRSLGFSAAVTAGLAALELCVLAALGLVVGIPLGAYLNSFFMRSFETDSMAFRAILPWWTHAATVATVFALVAVSAYSGMRRLRAMNLAHATKSPE